MFCLKVRKTGAAVFTTALILATMFAPLSSLKAADHAESTSVSKDVGADIADTFAFLSPVDNSRVVLSLTFDGFIIPSQATNNGYFSPEVLYRFEIENTGDAVPDQYLDVTFTPQTSRTQAQTATITVLDVRRGRATFRTRFTGQTTVPNNNPEPPPFVVNTNSESGISFFAGLVEDPFYFDNAAFGRFTAAVATGDPDPFSRLNRARDGFAGYNIHGIALEVPADLLRGSAGNVIGVNGVTLRARNRRDTRPFSGGALVQIDRQATPAVNTVLIPFPRKNEYNAATPQDDARGRFANSIVASLTSLGTNAENIGILASVAVANGDYLRLNLATPNTSQGAEEDVTTPGYTGFPNGRRLGDDTVDTLIYFVTNQTRSNGDNVDRNERPLTNSFPFFGLPYQLAENPTIDDGTRN